VSRRRWRWAYLLWLPVPALVGLIAYRHQAALVPALQVLSQVSVWWLGLSVAGIAAVYLCRATLFAIPLRLLGYSLPRFFLWSTALVATSIHQAIPSVGMSGYAVLTYSFHRRGIRLAQASLVVCLDALSNLAVFATVVLGGFAYAAMARARPGNSMLLGFLMVAVAAAVLGLLAAYVYRLQRDERGFTERVLRLKQGVGSLLRRSWPDEPVVRFLRGYYQGKAAIRANRGVFSRMLGLQCLAVCCDLGALYASFLAIGLTLPVWVLLMGLMASTAGLVMSGAPGGGGSFEAIMTAFLVGHGVGKVDAIAGVIVYRFVAFWLPLSASALLARHVWRARLWSADEADRANA
jgi:uncharacterized protein (TIRG00374 family)